MCCIVRQIRACLPCYRTKTKHTLSRSPRVDNIAKVTIVSNKVFNAKIYEQEPEWPKGKT